MKKLLHVAGQLEIYGLRTCLWQVKTDIYLAIEGCSCITDLEVDCNGLYSDMLFRTMHIIGRQLREVTALISVRYGQATLFYTEWSNLDYQYN